MLDPALATRIRDSIGVQTEPRDRLLAETVGVAANRLNARGMLRSGNAIREYNKLADDELTVRARIVWATIRRSHASMSGAFTDTTRVDLGEQLAAHIHEQAARVADVTLSTVRAHIPGEEHTRGAIAGRARELLREAEIELRFYIDELSLPAPAPGTSPIINIHGNVGAVQTGTYATATLQLGGPEHDRLIAALQELAEAMRQSSEGPEEDRAETLDLVQEAVGDLQTAHPNRRRIAALLAGISQTVQTMASVRGAAQLVRDAATALGF